MRSWRIGVAVGAATLLVGAAGAATGATATPSPASEAATAYARMTPAQRIGQLLMGAVPDAGSTAAARTVLARYHVGNVVLTGQSHAGVAGVAATLGPVRRATTQAGVAPLLAVDQEGGLVQHLDGQGFSAVPAALRQGQLPPATLRADWQVWAAQLRRAGINLDLAPVCDVVPARVGTANQPIGRYDREYGHTRAVVAAHVTAVVQGIRSAGVLAAAKHFPGLGRASGNTDTAAGVTDPTTRHDPRLAPFAAAVSAGVPLVMVSTATYPDIAPGQVAAFSHLVVTTMLRHELGFTGLIISDSLTSAAVRDVGYGARATLALSAGVDLLLVSVNTPVAAMTSAIASRARTDAVFASVVRTAVLRVLTAKARAGLLSP